MLRKRALVCLLAAASLAVSGCYTVKRYNAMNRAEPADLRAGTVSFIPFSGPVIKMKKVTRVVNSAWLDQVMMRFYASMGDLFPFYRWAASRPSQGPDLRRWREREGIDFAVDVWNGRTWDRVAVVPPVGPKALRHLALPLSAVRADSSEREIRVRVTGGPGFLRVDQLALSSEARQRAVAHTLRPASARDGEGQDARPALEDADGHYHRLERVGDQIDLVFRQPPRAAGLRRAAFLRSVGFHSPWKPEDRKLALDHVRKIWRQPGGLARFSHDLFRQRMRKLRLAAAGASR